jgi:predicted membrane protein
VHVNTHVGIGRLEVIVPRNTPVAVDAHAKAGDVHVLGRHADGRDATLTTGVGGARLSIDAEIGAGRIDVVRRP